MDVTEWDGENVFIIQFLLTRECKDFHYSFTGLMLQGSFALFLLLTQSKGVPHLLPSALKGKWLAPSVRVFKTSYSILPWPEFMHFPFLFRLLPWEADSHCVCGRCQAAASTSFCKEPRRCFKMAKLAHHSHLYVVQCVHLIMVQIFGYAHFVSLRLKSSFFPSCMIFKLKYQNCTFYFREAEILTVSYCSRVRFVEWDLKLANKNGLFFFWLVGISNKSIW